MGKKVESKKREEREGGYKKEMSEREKRGREGKLDEGELA